MRLQIFHFSDIHFEDVQQLKKIHTDQIVQILNSMTEADQYLIIVSGDIAKSGLEDQYGVANAFLDSISKKIKAKTNREARIIVCPGNHDINFEKYTIDKDTIDNAYKNDGVDSVVESYLNRMTDFFTFSKLYNCFEDGGKVSKHIVSCGECSIGIVLLNTAPFSLLGGSAMDMIFP